MTFTIELERENDDRWLAEVADLPGVMCYAAGRAEAVARVQALALRVIAERLEHREGPAELLNVTFQPGEQLAPPECRRVVDSLLAGSVGIVRRVDVVDHEWPDAVDLDRRVAVSPCVMRHLRGNKCIRTRPERRRRRLVAAFPHAEPKCPAQDCQVFVARVPMRRNARLAAIAESQQERRPFLIRISRHDGYLSTRSQLLPLNIVGRDDALVRTGSGRLCANITRHRHERRNQ